MQTYTILIEGYAHPGDDCEYYASPTTTLIEDNGLKVLVDPGANREMLEQALKDNDLKPADIDLVYLTHYHPDHFLNIRLFPNTIIYDGGTKWDSDAEYFHSGVIPGTNIQILATPGHSPEHTSLLIETADEGKVCIAQDVFWWEDGKQDTSSEEVLLDLVDPFASDVDALRESRKLVLSSADWIIPGHGKKFKS